MIVTETKRNKRIKFVSVTAARQLIHKHPFQSKSGAIYTFLTINESKRASSFSGILSPSGRRMRAVLTPAEKRAAVGSYSSFILAAHKSLSLSQPVLFAIVTGEERCCQRG